MISKTLKIKLIFFLSIFCAVLMLPKVALAATYYVANNGNDSNPGTQLQPLKNHPWMPNYTGFVILQPGDTVYLKRGDSWIFSSPSAPAIEAKQSGSDGALIRTTAYGSGAMPLIKIATATPKQVIKIQEKSYLQFDNLDIQHYGSNPFDDFGYVCVFLETVDTGNVPHHIYIKDNEISNCPAAGIYGHGDSHHIYIGNMAATSTATALAHSNNVHHCGSVGISLTGRDAATGRSDYYIYQNYVHEITATTCHTSVYGIQISASNSVSSGFPRYAYVRYNRVENVPAWTCYDNHGGSYIYFENNYGYGCPFGFSGGENGYPPIGVSLESDQVYIRYNTMENPPDLKCADPANGGGWDYFYLIQTSVIGAGGYFEVVGNKGFFTSRPSTSFDWRFIRLNGIKGGLIEGNEFWNGQTTNAGSGITLYKTGWPNGTHNLTIQKNIIRDVYAPLDIYPDSLDGDLRVYSNVLQSDKGSPIKIEYASSGIVTNIDFFNNTLSGGAMAPVFDFDSNDIKSTAKIGIKNNIFSVPAANVQYYGNGFGSKAGTLDIDNNLYYGSGHATPFYAPGYGNANWAGWQAQGLDINGIYGQNPKFASPGDYHLQQDSPAVNAGRDVGLTSDLEGYLFVGLLDIGAYEYGGSPSSDSTPPTTPSNLSATAISSSQINLSWTASTDNTGVTGYKIYKNGIQIATTSNTTYSNTGLSPSTVYSYTISAYDAAGNNSNQSGPVSATTLAGPSPTPICNSTNCSSSINNSPCQCGTLTTGASDNGKYCCAGNNQTYVTAALCQMGACSTAPPPPPPSGLCGNGKIDTNEVCDKKGNIGCSAPTANCKTDCGGCISCPYSSDFSFFGKPVVCIATDALQWILSIAGSLFLIMLIIGGSFYMFSGPSPERQDIAKKIINYAIIGLALILVSYAMMTVVDKLLTK